MIQIRIFSIALILSVASIAFSQPAERRTSRKEYIERYKDDAIREMLRTGVPASITLAQGILESGDGNSPLAKYANNHFGIKCHGWQGMTFYKDDDRKNECFRKYNSVYESFIDHSDFLKKRSRYAFLFEYSKTDYKRWARGLRKAGYATNPKYADLLIMIIEENELVKYDTVEKIPVLTAKLKEEVGPKQLPKKKHQIKVHDNSIKYVIAQKNDSYYKIATEFDMGLWQIYKYNDLAKGDIIKRGDVIYLQPKRSKAIAAWHTVKIGETIRDISQKYGVKIKSIYSKNNLPIGTELKAGQKLSLRKRVR